MSFLFKLTIAILIVFAILFPILISSDNKLSALFWKIPKDFWVFLIIMYGAIITVVFITVNPPYSVILVAGIN